jgi:hypothetical protein
MNALAMAVDDVDGASVPAISTLLLKNEIDDGMGICWGLDIRYPYCGGVRTKPWVRLNDMKGTSCLFRDQFSISNNIQLEAPVFSFPLTETPGDTHLGSLT